MGLCLLQRFPPTEAEIAAFQKGNGVISLGKASHAHEGSSRSKRKGPPGAAHFTFAQIQVKPGTKDCRLAIPGDPALLTLWPILAERLYPVLVYRSAEIHSARRMLLTLTPVRMSHCIVIM